jgi:hypothetical protein
MHAALAFLLVLTIHRCYPTGVPQCLQGDLIRRQIRRYPQTLSVLWAFAILINLPLFVITKYETIQSSVIMTTVNNTNITYSTSELSCFTGATEIWSRTYLILLLVLTYVITGIFLIVIYGQVIRIILASKKYANNPIQNTSTNDDHYRYLSPNDHQYRSKMIVQLKSKRNRDNLGRHFTSLSFIGDSTRRQQLNPSSIPIIQNGLNRSSANSHSIQHVQIIVMLFIVILLYILLLLPYRLLNLLYIIHNQLFQQTFMNEILFRWLLNTVRLLVFLNCALQPITYLIISSRLRQTVIKLLRSSCFCTCQCSATPTVHTKRHNKNDNRRPKHQQTNRHTILHVHRDSRPLQTSLNNHQLVSYPCTPLNSLPTSRSPLLVDNTRYPILFTNKPRT